MKASIGRDVSHESLTQHGYVAHQANETASFQEFHRILSKYFTADVIKELAEISGRTEDLKTIEGGRTDRTSIEADKAIKLDEAAQSTEQLRIRTEE